MGHDVPLPLGGNASRVMSLPCCEFYFAQFSLSRIPQVQLQPDGGIAKTCTATKRTCAPACQPAHPQPHTHIFPSIFHSHSRSAEAKLVALGSDADAGVDCKPQAAAAARNADHIGQCENKAQRVQNPNTDAVQCLVVQCSAVLSSSLRSAPICRLLPTLVLCV